MMYSPSTGRFNRLDPFSGNVREPQSFHKYAYAHDDPVNGIDPTGESFADSWSLQGIAAHVAFSEWAKTQRADVEPGVQLGTMFEDLEDFVTSLLKPDLLDRTTKEIFELKPARHSSANDGYYQWLDRAQMAGYELALGSHGYSAGDSEGLVPYTPGGMLVSHILTKLAGYEVRLWPADDPMMPSNQSGEGLIWYSVTKLKRRPPQVPVPVTEVVKVYEGERVKIRTWEPRYLPVIELNTAIQPQVALAVAVGATAVTAAVAMHMSVAALRVPI